MLVKYVCEYCGTIHSTKEEALGCEKEAEEIKPKFKAGDTAVDQNNYKYKVLWVERWRMDFDKVLEKIMAEEFEDLNIPLYEHTFLCVLEALDPERKNESIFTSVLPYAILKQPLPRRKGIMLENEYWLRKTTDEEK